MSRKRVKLRKASEESEEEAEEVPKFEYKIGPESFFMHVRMELEWWNPARYFHLLMFFIVSCFIFYTIFNLLVLIPFYAEPMDVAVSHNLLLVSAFPFLYWGFFYARRALTALVMLLELHIKILLEALAEASLIPSLVIAVIIICLAYFFLMVSEFPFGFGEAATLKFIIAFFIASFVMDNVLVGYENLRMKWKERRSKRNQ